MPLENVWIHIAQKLKDHGIVAFYTDSLLFLLFQLWKRLCVNGYFSDVQGMPQHLREVIVRVLSLFE
jgi:hypothetical protein